MIARLPVMRTALVQIMPLLALVLGCAGPRSGMNEAQRAWLAAEGLRTPTWPYKLRPARTANEALAANGHGELVVHVATAHAASSRPFEVQLFPNSLWRDVIARDSTDTHGRVAFPRLRPGAYSGFVRRVGFNQQLFRLEITAGFVDTLELHPGIVGH